MQVKISSDRAPKSSDQQGEQNAIQSLHGALSPLGVSWTEAVAIWIGLKSKHGLILQTPAGEAADPAAQRIARLMLGEDWHRMIQLQGHPWWAGRTPQLVLMQQRLSSLRLRAFLTEAAQEFDNRCTRFILLRGIGRAELQGVFGKSPNLRPALGGVMDLPWELAAAPSIVRENLFVIATEGQPLGAIQQREILDFSLVLSLEGFREAGSESASGRLEGAGAVGQALASARSLSPHDSRSLIPPAIEARALRTVRKLLALLDRYAIRWEPGMLRDAYLYIGHAWDGDHCGLFAADARENLRLAEDFWLSRSAIPRIWRAAKRRGSFWPALGAMLADRFPLAQLAWRRLAASAAT